MISRALVFSLALAATPSFSEEFSQNTRGAYLHGTYVLDTWGKAIPLELGVQWLGVRSFGERKHVFTFDAAAALFAAYGGNSAERFYLLGGTARGRGDFGLRFSPEQNTSLYAGASLLVAASAVSALGVAPDKYNQINKLDGIAGLYGNSALRLNGGVSMLHGASALLVIGFVGESVISPGSPASGPLYTDLGVRARFDLVESFGATVEGLWGTTFGRVDAFGVSNTATHWKFEVAVRKEFGRIWLALDAQIHGATNTAVLAPNNYLTSSPTFASVGLTFGVSL